MGGYLGMHAPRLVAFLGRPRGLLALMPVIAAAVALGVSLAQPERFRASADVWLGRTTDATTLVAGDAGVETDPDPDAASLALATLDSAAARVKRRFPGPSTVAALRREVDVKFKPSSDLVTVTAESGEPSRAARLANAFAGAIAALRREAAQAETQRAIDALSRRIREREAGGSLSTRLAALELLKALGSGDAQTVGRAAPPASPSSPKPLRNALLAAIAALVAGLLGLLLRTRGDDRLRDEDELMDLIPAGVLGRIPEARVGEDDPAFAEAIELLAMRLELMRQERACLVLAVTSPAERDGKTTLVSRLAHSLASRGAEVTRATVGPHTTERLRHTLALMRDEADFVLVDAAPVTSSAAASAVAATADGVLLVVDLAGTRRGELLAATRQLANARAQLLGIVLNRASAPSRQYVPRERRRASDAIGPPTFTA
jgi:capsular polysaccharide biosynthesis protein